jgi:hypothetical protein
VNLLDILRLSTWLGERTIGVFSGFQIFSSDPLKCTRSKQGLKPGTGGSTISNIATPSAQSTEEKKDVG